MFTQNLEELVIDNQIDKIKGQQFEESLYKTVISSVERPLFIDVLKKTRGNQTEASKMLGISRGTLRTKMAKYGLL